MGIVDVGETLHEGRGGGGVEVRLGAEGEGEGGGLDCVETGVCTLQEILGL